MWDDVALFCYFKTLPLLEVSTKLIYLYLQTMLDLEQTNPALYVLFTSGNHVLQRNHLYLAGLSTEAMSTTYRIAFWIDPENVSDRGSVHI